MITVWGDKQDGSWQIVDAQEDFSPNVVYQFNYVLPEKPWWAFLLPFLPWPLPPTTLRNQIMRAVAAEANIPEEEIHVLWFSYNSQTDAFHIQLKWVPAAPETIGALPVLIPLALIVAAIATPLSLYLIGKYMTDLAPETIEKLVEEGRKSIMWIAITMAFAVTGGAIFYLTTRSKKK